MSRYAMSALVLSVGLMAVGGRADDKPKEDTKKDEKPFSDAEFVKKAAVGGMTEVALGKLAVSNGKSEAVKKFGQKMIDDHSKAGDALKEAAKTGGFELPAKLDDEHQKHVDTFKDLKGEEFDKAYIKDMVQDHEKDVAEFTKASKELKDADLKEFAAKTLTVVQGHLEMVEKLDRGGK